MIGVHGHTESKSIQFNKQRPCAIMIINLNSDSGTTRTKGSRKYIGELLNNSVYTKQKICLSVHPSVCLSIHQSVCLFIHLSILICYTVLMAVVMYGGWCSWCDCTVFVGVTGCECGQRVRLHWWALQRPPAAAKRLRSVSFQRSGLPLQPVRPAGARQR